MFQHKGNERDVSEPRGEQQERKVLVASAGHVAQMAPLELNANYGPSSSVFFLGGPWCSNGQIYSHSLVLSPRAATAAPALGMVGGCRLPFSYMGIMLRRSCREPKKSPSPWLPAHPPSLLRGCRERGYELVSPAGVQRTGAMMIHYHFSLAHLITGRSRFWSDKLRAQRRPMAISVWVSCGG